MSRLKDRNYEIAYICNGKNPKCRGRVGCYYAEPVNGIMGGCCHTLDERYSLHKPASDHPSRHPERFDKVECEGRVRYYERFSYEEK